ncbi:MAG: SirB2 family protein [Gammaproteobacteria bacterium]|nr:SirB2 family protein [Gammaproteobacteria bacterium]
MSITVIKMIHMACAGISLVGFILRGLLKMKNSPLLQQRWIRIVPHIVDTLLIVSAIALVIMLQLNVLQQPWLLAKIAGLTVYIFLGVVTLKLAKTATLRWTSFFAALIVFVYILAVAHSHLLWPW